jgi:hypothetical protein
MDKISTQHKLKNKEKASTKGRINEDFENLEDAQPSEKTIKNILDYSKSLQVLKSKNPGKDKLCNIN